MVPVNNRRGFSEFRVVAFESRQADQMARLIERYGGRPIVAPSMREIPLDQHGDVLRFGERLLNDEFGMVIFLTGVGAGFMLKVLDTRWPREHILAALARTITVTRGPKPSAVLREEGLTPTILVPEPNTWKDLVQALDGIGRPLTGMAVAVQEYGVPNTALLDALRERGASVTTVPVYRWALPEDLAPLTAAIRGLIRGEAEMVLFTNAVQVDHVFQVAREAGQSDAFRRALGGVVVSAVGPIVTERLREFEIPVDFVPSHPKMGVFVRELSERAVELLEHKRSRPLS
jgi:uroporphyrinogen-III synthase